MKIVKDTIFILPIYAQGGRMEAKMRTRRHNKIIAAVLVGLMVVGSLPQIAWANLQAPIARDTFRAEITADTTLTDPITKEKILRPNIKLSWEEPSPSTRADTSFNLANTSDASFPHPVEYYQIRMRNMSRNEAEKEVATPKATEFTSGTIFNIHEKAVLQTGSLYGFKVIPVHEHAYDIGDGKTQLRPAPMDGLSPEIYALTDFNTKIEGQSGELVITWDKLQYAGKKQPLTYVIYYAKGNVTSAATLKGGFNRRVEETQAIEIQNKDTNRMQLKFSINDSTIEAGQQYSVIVEPIMATIREDLNVDRVFVNPKPFIAQGYTRVTLNVQEVDGKYVRLTWGRVPPELDDGSKLENIVIRKREDLGEGDAIVTLFGDVAKNIGYYLYLKPSVTTEYRIQMIYKKKDGSFQTVSSDWKKFDPKQVPVIPTKPIMPKILPPSFNQTNIEDYVLSGDDTKPQDPHKYKGTFRFIPRVNSDIGSINLVWSGFIHDDFKNPTGTPKIDLTTKYDVWITDDPSALDYMEAKKEIYIEPELENTSAKLIRDKNKKVLGYFEEFSKYYDKSSDQFKDIIRGKLYYIKIVAKQSEELRSEPTLVAVYWEYSGEVFTPPVISKPPLKQRMQAKTSVVVQWQKQWEEVFVEAQDDGKDWYARMWRVGNHWYGQNPAFRDPPLTGQEKMAKDITGTHVIPRTVFLGDDVFYESMIIPYAKVEQTIKDRKQDGYSLKNYMEDKLFDEEKNGQGAVFTWNRVVDITKDITDQQGHTLLTTVKELTPNTPYLYLLRAYRILPDGEVRTAAYPTPIIITTLADIPEMDVDPNVPTLRKHIETDTSITVKWNYNADLRYILEYGETEDRSKAKPIQFTAATKNTTDFLVPIKGLFPETGYYFWLSATKKGATAPTGNNKPPASMRLIWTMPIQPEPLLPPTGFGIAGIDKPVAENYITVEWLREKEDIDLISEKPAAGAQSSEVKKVYSYIIEMANNIDFKDVYTLEITPESRGKKGEDSEIFKLEDATTDIVKFMKNIRANTMYYFRVKTKITVTQGATGAAGVAKEKTKESQFSPILRIFTNRSGGEYDSETDPAKIILPPADSQEEFKGGVWTYRFRGFKEDQKDNRVDQRFVSKLIEKGVYTYTIDLKKYKNENIRKRVVEMPYTILTAMQEQKISLRIVTDTMDLILPPKALQVPAFKTYGVFGDPVDLRITMTTDIGNKPYPGPEYDAIAMPQNIEIGLSTRKGLIKTNFTQVPLEISLQVRSRGEVEQKDAAPYVYNENMQIWEPIEGQYNKADANISFKTGSVGSYALFGRRISTVLTDPSVRAVLRKYNVQDLDKVVKTGNQSLTVMQYNALLIGIANNKPVIDLQKNPTQIEKNQADKAGITIGGSLLTVQPYREEVMPALVRLYEIQTGAAVDVQNSGGRNIKGYNDITPKFRKSMEKAAELGFLGESNTAQPKKPMSVNEIFQILHIILQDAGKI